MHYTRIKRIIFFLKKQKKKNQHKKMSCSNRELIYLAALAQNPDINRVPSCSPIQHFRSGSGPRPRPREEEIATRNYSTECPPCQACECVSGFVGSGVFAQLQASGSPNSMFLNNTNIRPISNLQDTWTNKCQNNFLPFTLEFDP